MSANRSCLCVFTFVDGRRCGSPRLNGHPHLSCFLAKREAQSLAAQQVGRDVSSFLSGSYLSACDLSSALDRLFSAVAPGQVKTKTGSTLPAPPQSAPQPAPRQPALESTLAKVQQNKQL